VRFARLQPVSPLPVAGIGLGRGFFFSPNTRQQVSITHFAEVLTLNNLLYGLSVLVTKFGPDGPLGLWSTGKMKKKVHINTENRGRARVSRCNQELHTYHTRRNQD
jgi:hypothetical protein